MSVFHPKVGVVSCSGEACVEGTISRVATRLVLEDLRSENTVTICLPLFLAGGEDERMFAMHFPTIAVDGCEKRCGKIAIEKYSGKTVDAIVVSEILEKGEIPRPTSRRTLDEKGIEVALRVAREIAERIDKIFEKWGE